MTVHASKVVVSHQKCSLSPCWPRHTSSGRRCGTATRSGSSQDRSMYQQFEQLLGSDDRQSDGGELQRELQQEMRMDNLLGKIVEDEKPSKAFLKAKAKYWTPEIEAQRAAALRELAAAGKAPRARSAGNVPALSRPEHPDAPAAAPPRPRATNGVTDAKLPLTPPPPLSVKPSWQGSNEKGGFDSATRIEAAAPSRSQWEDDIIDFDPGAPLEFSYEEYAALLGKAERASEEKAPTPPAVRSTPPIPLAQRPAMRPQNPPSAPLNVDSSQAAALSKSKTKYLPNTSRQAAQQEDAASKIASVPAVPALQMPQRPAGKPERLPPSEVEQAESMTPSAAEQPSPAGASTSAEQQLEPLQTITATPEAQAAATSTPTPGGQNPLEQPVQEARPRLSLNRPSRAQPPAMPPTPTTSLPKTTQPAHSRKRAFQQTESTPQPTKPAVAVAPAVAKPTAGLPSSLQPGEDVSPPEQQQSGTSMKPTQPPRSSTSPTIVPLSGQTSMASRGHEPPEQQQSGTSTKPTQQPPPSASPRAAPPPVEATRPSPALVRPALSKPAGPAVLPPARGNQETIASDPSSRYAAAKRIMVSGTRVSAFVVRAIKGGLLLEWDGIQGFLPGKLMSEQRFRSVAWKANSLAMARLKARLAQGAENAADPELYKREFIGFRLQALDTFLGQSMLVSIQEATFSALKKGLDRVTFCEAVQTPVMELAKSDPIVAALLKANNSRVLDAFVLNSTETGVNVAFDLPLADGSTVQAFGLLPAEVCLTSGVPKVGETMQVVIVGITRGRRVFVRPSSAMDAQLQKRSINDLVTGNEDGIQEEEGNLPEAEVLCLALTDTGLLAVPGKRVQGAAIAPELQVMMATGGPETEPGNFTLLLRVQKDVQVVHVQSDMEREAVKGMVMTTVARLKI